MVEFQDQDDSAGLPIQADGGGAQVLLFGDDEDSIEVLCIFLELWGAQVVQTVDLQQSLSKSAKPPDVILLDERLPTYEGPSITREIRSLASGHKIPIVVLSVRSEPKWQAAAFAAGCDEYLVKPYELDDLGLVLKRQIDGNHTRSKQTDARHEPLQYTE